MCPLPGFTQRVLRNIPSSRAQRLKRQAVLKKNAFDPELERGARYNRTVVPVESINREWWKTSLSGRRSHLRCGIYYEVFQQILLCEPYTPWYNFTVTYPPNPDLRVEVTPDEKTDASIPEQEQGKPVAYEPVSHPVLCGNTILPRSAISQPSVDIDWSQIESKYATLLLTNPDGYILNPSVELVHWLVANIPREKDLEAGQVLKEYLQPLPFFGTGLHRYVYFLIEHNQPLTYNENTPTTDETSELCELEKRTFLTSQFLSDNHIVPSDSISYRLFLSMWDHSVSSCLINDLKVTEPYYEVLKRLKKGKRKAKIIRQVRSDKFKID